MMRRLLIAGALAAAVSVAATVSVYGALVRGKIDDLESQISSAEKALATEQAAHAATSTALAAEKAARASEGRALVASVDSARASCRAMVELATRQQAAIEEVFHEQAENDAGHEPVTGDLRRLDAGVLRNLTGASPGTGDRSQD